MKELTSVRSEGSLSKNPPVSLRRVVEKWADDYFLSVLFVFDVSDFVESLLLLSDEVFALAVSDFIESALEVSDFFTSEVFVLLSAGLSVAVLPLTFT